MNQTERTHCKDFGNLLKKYRIDSGLSQKDVSIECNGISSQFISNVERGVCWPPMNLLAKMSEMYNVPKTVLLNHLMDYRKKVWASQLGLRVKSSV